MGQVKPKTPRSTPARQGQTALSFSRQAFQKRHWKGRTTLAHASHEAAAYLLIFTAADQSSGDPGELLVEGGLPIGGCGQRPRQRERADPAAAPIREGRKRVDVLVRHHQALPRHGKLGAAASAVRAWVGAVAALLATAAALRRPMGAHGIGVADDLGLRVLQVRAAELDRRVGDPGRPADFYFCHFGGGAGEGRRGNGQGSVRWQLVGVGRSLRYLGVDGEKLGRCALNTMLLGVYDACCTLACWLTPAMKTATKRPPTRQSQHFPVDFPFRIRRFW